MTASTNTNRLNNLGWALSDVWEMTKRNMLRYLRLPQLLVFSTVQPVMFTLLFAFVFGGAIDTPGGEYINFLIPGIIIQTVLFGSTQTGVGLAEDLSKGLIDRFRSLPMSRAAVLAGRTVGDFVRNIIVILIVLTVGLLIGFRPEGSVVEIGGAVLLAALLGFSFSWISATIAMVVRDQETVQVAGFVWIFPLVFASSAFVPVETMPEWLQTWAEISPVTVAINSIRGLMLGPDFRDLMSTFGGVDFRAQLLQTIGWIAAFLLVFMPLAVRFYRRKV